MKSGSNKMYVTFERGCVFSFFQYFPARLSRRFLSDKQVQRQETVFKLCKWKTHLACVGLS